MGVSSKATREVRTVTLNIPRLGGVQDFRICSAEEANRAFRYRYVCTYFPDRDPDEFSDKQYDIVHIMPRKNAVDEQEYVAVP